MATRLACLLFAALVTASSYPDQTNCWAEDPAYGTTIMKWTLPAVRTNAYTLRTADSCDPTTDPTTYVPGQFMSIHLRTHQYKGQFRGLLIYATDGAKNRVGDWKFDWPNSNMFWLPGGECQNRSLMHLNGAEKYYHHEFKFKGPNAGTGPIEFHTLIKRGEANLGEFYFANLDKNLMLNEGSATSAGDVWVEGAAGTSCTQTCTAAGKTCDATLLNNAKNWAGALQVDVLKTVGCASPPLTSDTAVSITRDQAGWCTYPSPLAPAGTAACDAAATSDTTPVCPCGSAGVPSFGAVVPPAATACLNYQVLLSPAAKASSNVVTLVLALLTGSFLGQRKQGSFLLTLVCVLFCAYTVQAHNWVYAVSRSFNQASTYKPCRPRVTDAPHWQINQGQTFNMEWATGHDHYFYFTVVRAEHILELENTTQRDLDNYITACGAAQDYMRTKTANPNFWHKQHMNHQPTPGDQGLAMADRAPIFQKNISATDPEYIQRHEKFGTYGNEVRWLYNPKYYQDDKRCSYYNAQFPHIFAVHRFVQVETVASRAGDRDIARFTIELSDSAQGQPQGQFLIQYLWRGYFDCADIDLFPNTTVVTAIGGRPLRADEPQWNKVDHCQFEEVQNLETGCSEVVTNADRCLKACVANVNCLGVNAVPLWLPQTVYPLFSNRVGIPWTSPNGMMRGCDRGTFEGLGRNAKVCYGVNPRQANNTHSMYSVTDDPEDPLFYATCFIKRSQWAFDLSLGNTTVIIPVPPAWNFGGKCVDCMEWKASQENFNIPTWTLPTQCVNCDKAVLPPVSTLSGGSLIAKGMKCDGQWSGRALWSYHTPSTQCANVKCTKTLAVAGTNEISAEECVAKAKADSDCSEWVMHQGNSAISRGCECYLKDPCCGKCVPVDSYFSNWQWNVFSTKKQNGDATCANGVKSADGAYCCSSSCTDASGTPVCMSRPAFQVSFQGVASANPPGWAVDNGQQLGARTTLGYTSALSSRYGWNCDLSQSSTDFNPDDGLNYHSTVIKADSAQCSLGTVPMSWTLEVPSGVYQVDTLYSQPGSQMRGCKIQGLPNFERNSLGGSDMAWVSRVVTANNSQIVLSGASNGGCSGYTAVVVYNLTTAPTTVTPCQNLPGMCCPFFYDMENRPCASFEPPCKL